MLRPSGSPLSFLLRLSYLWNAPFPTTGSVVVVNATTLNVAPNDSLGAVAPISDPTPVCVNNIQHPSWGPTLGQFDYNTCREAVELVTKKLESDMYKSFVFYSRQVYPIGREGWPLAQGGGSCESNEASLSPSGKGKTRKRLTIV